jgi:hypothetical protein
MSSPIHHVPSLIHSSPDNLFLKVHFLYGSRPANGYWKSEKKWFGGTMGGHVGIEAEHNRIISFIPHGRFHWFAKKKQKHSRYAVHDYNGFYTYHGGAADSNKKAVVFIPVSEDQIRRFNSITQAYLEVTPYDYAFFGMRCAAAAYDILAQLDILPRHDHGKTWRKIFYPKRLRKSLFRKAELNNWKIEREEGTMRRKWEQD